MERHLVWLDKFPLISSRFDGRGVCFSLGIVDPFKSEDQLSLHFNFLPKHLCRSDPKAAFAIECSVDHEVFFCFGMFGNANDLVFFPFIVTISTGVNRCQALVLRRLWCVHTVYGCSSF
jgi:hypothetical protein